MNLCKRNSQKSKWFYLVVAIFSLISCSKDPITYDLTVNAGEGGTVSPVMGSYESGSKVTITATPDPEYLFVGWSNGMTENPISIVVNSDMNLTANFSLKKYALGITVIGEGKILEEIINPSKDYDSGTVVKLTALPDSNGWDFIGWSGAVESIQNPIQVSMDQIKNLTATFSDSLKQSVIGKWDFEDGTNSRKGTNTEINESCSILSIIFNSDMTFKIYVGNTVVFGDFSITQNKIVLSIENESIGYISNVTVNGTSLSASFNIEKFCITVNVAKKAEGYLNGQTYMPDDVFEQIMIDAGIDDKLDNYVLTDNLKKITRFGHWRNSTWLNTNDGINYSRIFDSGERYTELNGNSDPVTGTKLYSINPGNKYKFIYNQSGLEDFENLESIQLFVNHLTEVDFSKNKKLIFYGIAYGTSNFKVRLPDPMPENLGMFIADFKWDSDVLDLSGDLFLASSERLWVYNFQPIQGYSTFIKNFNGLDKIKAKEFTSFGFHTQNIVFPENNYIKSLTLENSNLYNLDVSKLLNLESLIINGTLIQNVDLSKNVILKRIIIRYCKLENISLQNNQNLEILSLTGNNIETIQLSTNNKITSLDLSYNHLKQLNISNLTYLEYFNSRFNSNLNCIQVNSNQLQNITENWRKDDQATYSINCSN
ncbi:MAG: InlB B-repeat-containing protein [Flavobacteriaceae bacterium]